MVLARASNAKDRGSNPIGGRQLRLLLYLYDISDVIRVIFYAQYFLGTTYKFA